MFKNAKLTFMSSSCDLWLSFPRNIYIHHALGVEICVIFAQNTNFSTKMAIKSKKINNILIKNAYFGKAEVVFILGVLNLSQNIEIRQFEQVFGVD